MLPIAVSSQLTTLVVLAGDTEAINVAHEFVAATGIGDRCLRFTATTFGPWTNQIGLCSEGTLRRHATKDGGPIVAQKQVRVLQVLPNELDGVLSGGGCLLLQTGRPTKAFTFNRNCMVQPPHSSNPICQFRADASKRNLVSVLYNVFVPQPEPGPV